MMKRAYASLLSLLIICLLSPAASHSRRQAGKIVAVKAAHTLDVRSGAMIDNAVIIIEGESQSPPGSK
jgi:hypothetical protein